jgi:peptidoglycan/xylan/chitin deacetylase (PgdA/CDA1 family)
MDDIYSMAAIAQLSDLTNQAFYANNILRKPDGKKEIYSIFENVSDWVNASGNSSTGVADTDHYLTGTQGMKITPVGGNAQFQRTKDLSLVDKNIYLEFYVDDVSKVQYVDTLYDTATGTFSNYFSDRIEAFHLRNGWNKIARRPIFFTKQGGLTDSDLANIKLMRIRIVPVAGQSPNVTFDRIYTIPYGNSKAKVTIMFDDSHSTVFTLAKPRMDLYGMTGVVYTITGQIANNDYPDRMTTDKLKLLQDNGWDICSHTHTHRTLTTLTQEELEYELDESRKWLLRNGFSRGARHLATPGGTWDNTVLDTVKKYFATHRSTIPDDDCYPVANPYVLHCRNISNTTTLANVQTWVANAIASKSWVSLLFHYIADPDTHETQITPTKFNAIIDWLATQDIDIVTVSDMMDVVS